MSRVAASARIHPTAIVDPGARIGANVRIGPYSLIGPDVEIGDNTEIGPHVIIKGHTRIGRDNRIFQFCSLGEVPQDKKYAGEPTRLDAAGVGENGRHLRVGETGMAVHDGRIELVGVQFALGGDQHVTDHAQAIHLGVQGTQAVGELLGQHGNDAAREINAGGTFIGIDVDGIAGVHVMAHVGNGHQQAPALAG